MNVEKKKESIHFFQINLLIKDDFIIQYSSTFIQWSIFQLLYSNPSEKNLGKHNFFPASH